jgi:hypothetical protein
MRDVSDAFLLQMAEVSGGLFGLFLVGMLFYVETGFRRLGEERAVVLVPYFRASTRIVVGLFAIPLVCSLTLVVLEPAWSAVLFAELSVLLVAANVDTAIRIESVRKATGSTILLVNEILGTIGVALIVVLPWALGGIDPGREELTWAILVSFGTAFLSLVTLLIAVFDIEMSR